MGTKTGGIEAADFDVVDSDGLHHVEHGLAAVARALSSGGVYAEQLAWNVALEQQNRADAEHYTAAVPVVDLNAALQTVLDGGAS